MDGKTWTPLTGLDVSLLKLTDYLNQLSSNVVICGSNGTILFVNNAWARFSIENGYNGNAFVGQNYFAVCAAADGVEGSQAKVIASALHALAIGERDEVDIVYPCHAPHEKRWMRLNAVRAGDDLTSQQALLVIQHSQIANQPEAYLRDVSADREARLVHDLRNAVAPILMNVDLAQQLLGQENKGKLVDVSLERALRAVRRMDELMEGMLSRASIVSDTAVSIDQPIDLEAFILDRIRFLELESAKSSIRTHSELDSETRLAAKAEPLDRIVSNLLSNALKYTQEPRKIVCSMGLNRSGGIFLKIKDNGIGISRELLPKIFDQYRREEGTPPAIKGFGIGLAIVKEMVELLGGIIEVHSDINAGSVFKVEFPSWRTVFVA